MPKRGNGGVPLIRDIVFFLEVARFNEKLRLKVLSELRERAHGAGSAAASIASLSLTTLAIAVTLVVNLGGTSLSGDLYIFLARAILVNFAFLGVVLIWGQARARHAASWLAAYEDALLTATTRPRRQFGRTRGV